MSLDKMSVGSKAEFTAAIKALMLAVLQDPESISISMLDLIEDKVEETKPSDLYKKAAETAGTTDGRVKDTKEAFEAPYGQDREPIGYVAVLVKGKKVLHVLHGSEDEHRECVEKNIARAKQSPMHVINTLQGVDLEVRPYFL